MAFAAPRGQNRRVWDWLVSCFHLQVIRVSFALHPLAEPDQAQANKERAAEVSRCAFRLEEEERHFWVAQAVSTAPGGGLSPEPSGVLALGKEPTSHLACAKALSPVPSAHCNPH